MMLFQSQGLFQVEGLVIAKWLALLPLRPTELQEKLSGLTHRGVQTLTVRRNFLCENQRTVIT